MLETADNQPALAADDAQAAPVADGSGGPDGWPGRIAKRWHNASLLWRVFGINVAVCVVAVALLAWTPATVHRVATPSELVVLCIGLVIMLAADLVLLRRAFGPLQRLVAMMGAVDPRQPGRRAQSSARAGREVVALAEALNSMLDRLEDERLESRRRALAAQEAERARIARELHDEIGQTLTAVALQAERAADDPGMQRDALKEIAEAVLGSLEDVHRIGRELRPEALDDLGLVDALLALCSRIERQGDVRIRRDLSARLPGISSDVELVLYRVAQEALTNALRHSRCSEVRISLLPVGDQLVLQVSDDGIGLPAVRREGGIGGMRERAQLIGGELSLGARHGAGTVVRLAVPLESESRADGDPDGQVQDGR
jgi:two-component system, NarL family, sensor histidine kinase UhpB